MDIENTFIITFTTNNIETLYSHFNGHIRDIEIKLQIKVGNELNESNESCNPMFREILFRKATEFFTYNNPHKLSSVIMISPYNCVNNDNYNFWNKYAHETIITSYSIEIKLVVYENSILESKSISKSKSKLELVKNYKEIMESVVEECDQKKLKYIESKTEPDIYFDYNLNYM